MVKQSRIYTGHRFHGMREEETDIRQTDRRIGLRQYLLIGFASHESAKTHMNGPCDSYNYDPCLIQRLYDPWVIYGSLGSYRPIGYMWVTWLNNVSCVGHIWVNHGSYMGHMGQILVIMWVIWDRVNNGSYMGYTWA